MREFVHSYYNTFVEKHEPTATGKIVGQTELATKTVK